VLWKNRIWVKGKKRARDRERITALSFHKTRRKPTDKWGKMVPGRKNHQEAGTFLLWLRDNKKASGAEEHSKR
jgi:hypothetical protein